MHIILSLLVLKVTVVLRLIENIQHVNAIKDNFTNISDGFWGTYRPNLYFGIKSKQPDSLLAGNLYFTIADRSIDLLLYHSIFPSIHSSLYLSIY